MAERKNASSTTRGSTTDGSGSDQTTTRSRTNKETTNKMDKQTTGEKQGKTSTTTRTQKTKAQTIAVTFNVTVPEHTAKTKKSVYMTGNFSQINNKQADWDARSQKMKKVDATHYTLTIKGPADTNLEYKYTLGDWDNVELDKNCHDIGNRHFNLRGGDKIEHTVNDTVHNWRNTEK